LLSISLQISVGALSFPSTSPIPSHFPLILPSQSHNTTTTTTTVKDSASPSPLAPGFYAASDACPATCAAVGRRAATFHPFRDGAAGRVAGAPPARPAAACSARRADGTRAAGWQAVGGGPAVCNIVDGSAVVRATEHACLCLAPGEVQGLERARGGAGGCAAACKASITGAPGRSIAVGGGADHACLALSEQGLDNRFGTEVAGGACLTARGDVALASDSYSCVCAFSEGAQTLPPVAAEAAAVPQPTVETQSVLEAATAP
jgi:hypothetical protein